MRSIDTLRERWLQAGVFELQERVFSPIGEVLPLVHVSPGFSRGSRTAIGSCWSPDASKDKRSHIFICPTQSDSSRVLDILAHELIHALTPGHGHKGRFKQIAIRIGLEGKMTATIAGPKLKPRLDAIVKKIGKYPHAELTPGQRAAGSPKKQPIRLIKVKCQCGYTVRITRKWLEVGPPHCPLHGEMEEI